MIDYLEPKAWKTIASKFKIKDNGLEKALDTLSNLEEDAHEECLKAIGVVTQLANTLKKAKEVSAAAEAAKFLAGLTSVAERKKSEAAKARAALEKADKAQIAADKAKLAADEAKLKADKADAKEKEKEQEQEDKGDKDDKDDKKDGGFKALILSMMQKVKTARPDAPYQYLLCEAKPFPFVVIAKQINAGHRKLLEKASGGSKRFLKPGTITFNEGHFCFESDKNIPGAARRVQGFFKNLTGRKYPIMFGSQKATDDDDQAGGAEGTVGEAAAEAAKGVGAAGAKAGAGEGAPKATGPGATIREATEDVLKTPAATGAFSITASVGQGGKNKPADVQAVQTALNAKVKAGLTVDGKIGAKTIAAIKAFQQRLGKFKPDGLVEPGRATARALAGAAVPGPAPEPPKPKDPPAFGKGSIEKAADSWAQMLEFIEHNFAQVVKAVKAEYAAEHPTLVQHIDNNLKKLDAIPEKLRSGNLGNLLAQARDTKDPQERKNKLLACKTVVAQHINYVKSEPLLAHIDSNPWFKVNCRQGVSDCLTHVVQAIGKIG